MQDTNPVPGFEESPSEWFWDVIERAQRSQVCLEEILRNLRKDELIRFDHEFHQAACLLADTPYTNHLPGYSEDSLDDLTQWIVSQGRAYYLQVRDHPETMPQDADWNTTFMGIAGEVFWERFKEDIPRA